MDNIFAHLNTARQYLASAMSDLENAQGPGSELAPNSPRVSETSGAGGAVAAGLAAEHSADVERAEDRLLGALENGDDKLYDSLINPNTGFAFTESEKFDAIDESIDRELTELLSQPRPLAPADQTRIGELISLREGVERSHIINTLHQGGIDPRENLGLIDDLGSAEVADSLVDLNGSSVAIDQNTAGAILNGDLTIQTIEDKIVSVVDSDGNGVPESFNVDHDGDGVIDAEIPYGTYGYNPIGTTDIYVFGENVYGDPNFEREVQSTIIHEANHALNPPPKPFVDLTPQEQIEFVYETEFRAFWVDGTFEEVPENNRAEVINQFLIDNYPNIGAEYGSNSDFMDIVDNTTEPVGNLDNS